MNKGTVLIVGESWVVHSIHQKGFDSFTTTEYAEGVDHLRTALTRGGWEVEYQPAHIAARGFPETADALARYSAVIISDIGANTFLLHPDTFANSEVRPNRLVAIKDYVAAGGALVMIGGYMTFQGIDGKARYRDSPLAEVLPVEMLPHDDRVEVPQGAAVICASNGSGDLLHGFESTWPSLLGYNRLTAKSDAEVIATVDDDPLIVLGLHGDGRAVAFASDCGPHWVPEPFLTWRGFDDMWTRLLDWAAGIRPSATS